jgi:CRISPR-associated protein Cas1
MNKRTYYIFSEGELHRKDNTLRLCKEDGSYSDIPIENIYEIYIFSQLTINSALLSLLSKYSIVLHFFNYYEYYTGSFIPRESLLSGDLLVKQVEHYINNEKRIELSKILIKGAYFNIYRNLRYYNERGRDFSQQILEIETLINSIDKYNKITEVMAIEGNIRKVYYSCWNDIIIHDIDFVKRVKRPPDNMINSLISLLNSLFYTKFVSEIYKTQLNPTISYLHEPSTKRFSLALDLSEIFKPLIIDRLIFSLLNKKMINESDFIKDLNYMKIKDNALKIIVKELDNRLEKIIKHKTLKKNVSYKYLLRLECYKLIKHLIGDKNYEPFKMWW